MSVVVRRPEMNLTSTGQAIYVTLISEFMRNPGRFFTVHGRTFRHNPQQLNVCDRSSKRKTMFPDSMGGVLKVSTEAELQSLINRLMQNPIFFTVDIERSSKATCSNVRYITRGQLAVTVNTKHPHIAHLLQTQLAQGMAALKEGKNFAVEFNFNPIMVSWVQSLFQNQDDLDMCGCNTSYSSENGKVTVTSYSEFEDCFGCQYPGVLAWVVCFPCCLLSCPCYRVHRALTVEDFGGPVSGVIATYWSPVAQLRNLEETVACVLQLLNQEPAREATTVDLPPSYNDAVARGPTPVGPAAYYPPASQVQAYDQPQVQTRQPQQIQYPHQQVSFPPNNAI
ncbi:uncharacterized protein [Asterias amurensis]|uniref:uncharacterized protein n=1 Tax=Asterias amurensis TaxID=7602 RepID=UPI003AB2B0F5